MHRRSCGMPNPERVGVWYVKTPALCQTLLGAGASVVLEGQRVLPKRTADAGFRFQFAHVGPALASIFR